MGYVALWLWNLRGKLKPGCLFALWLIASSTERFLVEFLRLNDAAFIGLTQPQLWSLLLGLGGAAWLVVNARDGGLSRQPDSASGS
jgi:phosphatidylglycerol:prolipoprotein diacylglycerol transferase